MVIITISTVLVSVCIRSGFLLLLLLFFFAFTVLHIFSQKQRSSNQKNLTSAVFLCILASIFILSYSFFLFKQCFYKQYHNESGIKKISKGQAIP